MHELSVCLALLDQVEKIAHDNDAISVDRILLRIGPLSGIEADLLASAYPLAAAGTIAENAQLDIEQSSVVVRCKQCQSETEVPPNKLLCGGCGGYQTQVIGGNEMILQRLEFSAASA